MITKRELLVAICETPGWHPPGEASSIDRLLNELNREGWIMPRLDGWEATPAALDEYPDFMQADIARPIDERPPPTDPRDPPVESCAEHLCIPYDRVMTFMAALLHELPLVQIARLATVPREDMSEHPALWAVARDLADSLSRGALPRDLHENLHQ